MMRAINPPSFCTCAPPSLNSEKTLDGVDPANRQQQRASCVMLPLFLLSIYSFDSSLDRVSNRMCAPVRRARLCTPSLFFFLLQQTAPFFLLSFDTTSLSLSQCLASTWFARVKSTVLPGGENDVLIKPNKEPILCSRRQRGRRRDGREGERRAKMDG